MPLLSAADVRYALDVLRPNISLEETEDTWDKIAKAMSSLTKLLQDGAYDLNAGELIATIRSAQRPIINAMNSERTRLSSAPLELTSALATAMGSDFEQFLPLFMPVLLTLCARTNKVVINRAKMVILSIIETTQLASVLSYFLQFIKDKSTSMKIVIAEGTLACLNSCNPPDIEKESRATEVEALIRATARDANADVRKLSRKVFESYQILLPLRVSSFSAPLSPTTKKYLDIKSTTTLTSQTSSTNLRTNVNTKPEAKPQPSNNPSNSTSIAMPGRSGHSRNPSTSTISSEGSRHQMRSQSTTITRVTRKETSTTATAASAPYAPVRPIRPARVLTGDANPQRSTSTMSGPSRTTAPHEVKKHIHIPPSRPYSSTSSRSANGTVTTSSGAAHRVPITISTKPLAASGMAPPFSSGGTSTGPRRVIMPPPPPPAPKKETEGPKRPPSRVDSALSSSQRSVTGPVVPHAPIKKRPVSTLSSLPHPSAPTSSTAAAMRTRTKSTTSAVTSSNAASKAVAIVNTSKSTSVTGAASKASTKAPGITSKVPTKPAWGGGISGKTTAKTNTQSTAKPVSITSKPQAANTKTVVKKPSSRNVASTATTSRTTGTTNAKASKPVNKRPITPAMVALPPSPTPVEEETEEEKKASVAIDDRNKENVKPAVEVTLKANGHSSEVVEALRDGETGQEPTGEETLQADDDPTATNETLLNTALPSMVGATDIPIPAISAEDDFEAVGSEDEIHETATPFNNPQTPHQGLMAVPAAKAAAFAMKTPISALLSDIEHGFKFDYSPNTPLSPADNYLPNLNGETPYSHQTHAPHLKGPMQPFNHALHDPSTAGIFGGFGVMNQRARREDLVRGDIGVVRLDDYSKQFVSASLPGLDEGRQAFTELNRS